MKLRNLLVGVLIVLCGVMIPQIHASAQELQERTGHITDAEFQGVIETTMGSIVESRAATRTINWTVAPNERACTSFFGVAAGSYISMSFTLSQSAKVGIIDEDGYVRYVTGKSINHTFNITSSKAYCVFIQNLNPSAITVKGTYAWN